ncbi:MAG: GtrA family protein [Herbinix sp.]|nr:GtrA family protein [Herbinix sp.]
MKDKSLIIKLMEKIFSREFIMYGIAGVLTTIVNFISYHLLCNILLIPNLISNIIAWVFAVSFAYVINNRMVFLAMEDDKKKEAIKITKFFSARLITLGVEELGLLIFVDFMGFYNLLVKACLAVIVIILNYIFSKLYIFNK